MQRRDFCLFWATGLILRLAASYFAHEIEMSPTLLGIIVIALFTPPIVRRLHDLGYSGWLAIGVIAIPYVSILLLLFAGEKGSNIYGLNPKGLSSVQRSRLVVQVLAVGRHWRVDGWA
jgi:uncharacterized membrane protein YhaH (DUF805 family)